MEEQMIGSESALPALTRVHTASDDCFQHDNVP